MSVITEGVHYCQFPSPPSRQLLTAEDSPNGALRKAFVFKYNCIVSESKPWYVRNIPWLSPTYYFVPDLRTNVN